MKQRTVPQFKSNISSSSGMYKFENRIYQWSPYTDTVFSIATDLSYKPAMIISPGNHRLPKSNFQNLEDLKLYFHLDFFLETTQFRIIRYYLYNKGTIALIDKKSKKSYLSNFESEMAVAGINLIGGIINDLDGGFRFQPENYFVEENREYLVGLINAFHIKAFINSDEFKNSSPRYPEKKIALENHVKNIKETDNQILMIVRLKK